MGLYRHPWSIAKLLHEINYDGEIFIRQVNHNIQIHCEPNISVEINCHAPNNKIADTLLLKLSKYLFINHLFKRPRMNLYLELLALRAAGHGKACADCPYVCNRGSGRLILFNVGKCKTAYIVDEYILAA